MSPLLYKWNIPSPIKRKVHFFLKYVVGNPNPILFYNFTKSMSVLVYWYKRVFFFCLVLFICITCIFFGMIIYTSSHIYSIPNSYVLTNCCLVMHSFFMSVRNWWWQQYVWFHVCWKCGSCSFMCWGSPVLRRGCCGESCRAGTYCFQLFILPEFVCWATLSFVAISS